MVVEKAFCKTIFLHLIIKWLQTSFLTAFNEQKKPSITYKSYNYLALVYLLKQYIEKHSPLDASQYQPKGEIVYK
ncbi:bifunctional UDP-sugar hydrolase/5'-nucleotidase periplasmic [Yersinia enterocolitica]|nr:hypothetical protein [Yersinia enterocolitica]CNE88200.1 bifunctional UDP-sugar hydrolase/5'-nucleotidase periplasmic [Yersinia enterocolitica]